MKYWDRPTNLLVQLPFQFSLINPFLKRCSCVVSSLQSAGFSTIRVEKLFIQKYIFWNMVQLSIQNNLAAWKTTGQGLDRESRRKHRMNNDFTGSGHQNKLFQLCAFAAVSCGLQEIFWCQFCLDLSTLCRIQKNIWHTQRHNQAWCHGCHLWLLRPAGDLWAKSDSYLAWHLLCLIGFICKPSIILNRN